MNLSEIVERERLVRTDRLDTASQPVGRVPGRWLACYPIFQDALRLGETTFRALPEYARLVTLKRTTVDAEQTIASRILDEVRVSSIEICTRSVNGAIQAYLAKCAEDRNLHTDSLPTPLEDLAAQLPIVNAPLIERPPCVLHPGQGIFLDGWTRFLSYRARGDLTIPLLAIDWPDFHERLATPGR